jgi:hypothetical protein
MNLFSASVTCHGHLVVTTAIVAVIGSSLEIAMANPHPVACGMCDAAG